MLGLFKKKMTEENALDAFIHAVYGDPPPPKTAILDDAIRIVYEELLSQHIGWKELEFIATELNRNSVPYSTHDLAVSIALNLFKQPGKIKQLEQTQLAARQKVAHWAYEKKIVAPLADAFEHTLRKLYKL